MLKKVGFATILSLVGFIGYSQGFSQIQKVTAEDRDTEDRMGWSCDISGDYAIVGAYGDDFGAVNPNMGSAHIYERNDDGDWVFVQKIFNSDQDDYDRFGYSVAIKGDLAIIGAYGEDEDENDENTLSKAGSAYIFERGEDGTWTEVQKIVASDRAAGDEFGFSVSIDGDLAVVGAHYCNTNAAGGSYSLHAGAAYIFELEGGEWTETQKIVASDRWGNPGTEVGEEDWNWRFGEHVDVEGDYIAIGSTFAGKGYVFEPSGETWTEVDQLTYPGIAGLDRAAAVSISGTTIVLGAQTWDPSEDQFNAGGAAIFDRTGAGEWSFTTMIEADDISSGDHFGISVSIDGDYIVAGAHSDNQDEDDEFEQEDAGSAYIFKKIAGTWEEYDKVDAADRAAGDELGISVGISGSTAIVGAFQQDFAAGGGSELEDAGAGYFYMDDDDADCPTEYSSQSPSICEGESFTVGESVYTTSGTYTDEFLTIDGCDSIVTTYLNVIGEEPYEYEETICEGQSVTVGDSVYTEAGTYTNTFETEAGCDSIVETTVIVESGIDDNTISEFGSELSTSAFVDVSSYQWIKCEPYEEIPGANFPFFSPPGDGWYACVVTSTTGCVDTSDCYLVGDEPDDSGLEDLHAKGGVSIYPNPNNGAFTIALDEFQNEILTLDVLNELGQVVYSQTLTNTKNEVLLSNTSPGLYLIRLSNETERIYKRVIIQ